MMQPQAPTARIKIEFAQKSDPGRDPNKQINEDSCGYSETKLGHLGVLCDGMGGHYGGREASQLAIKTIFELFEQVPGHLTPVAALKGAVEEAGRRVYHLGGPPENRTRPGSTCVAILLHDKGADVAHVGDSRAYVIRAGQIYPLTRDHSMVQGMIDAGLLTEEQAIGHPDGNKITRALGMRPEVEVEVRPEPMELFPGDMFVLASDGLTDLARPQEILGAVKQALASGSLEHACSMLVQMANDRGGHDNITVQMARVLDVAPKVSQTIPQAPVDEGRPVGGTQLMGQAPMGQAYGAQAVPQAQGYPPAQAQAVPVTQSQAQVVPVTQPQAQVVPQAQAMAQAQAYAQPQVQPQGQAQPQVPAQGQALPAPAPPMTLNETIQMTRADVAPGAAAATSGSSSAGAAAIPPTGGPWGPVAPTVAGTPTPPAALEAASAPRAPAPAPGGLSPTISGLTPAPPPAGMLPGPAPTLQAAPSPTVTEEAPVSQAWNSQRFSDPPAPGLAQFRIDAGPGGLPLPPPRPGGTTLTGAAQGRGAHPTIQEPMGMRYGGSSTPPGHYPSRPSGHPAKGGIVFVIIGLSAVIAVLLMIILWALFFR